VVCRHEVGCDDEVAFAPQRVLHRGMDDRAASRTRVLTDPLMGDDDEPHARLTSPEAGW